MPETYSKSQYVFKSGILDRHVDDLLHFSETDEEVINQTSDDKRFKSRESYEKWLAKKRIIYTLVGPDKKLAGIVWFGETKLNEFPDYKATFAIRVYPPARGKGLAVWFARQAIDDYLTKNEYQQLGSHGIWLKAQASNLAAINTYKKLGFCTPENANDGNQILMLMKT